MNQIKLGLILLVSLIYGCSNQDKLSSARFTNPVIKKLETSENKIIILTGKELYSLREDTTEAVKIKLPDDLSVFDFEVLNNGIYIMGLGDNKIKLFKSEKDGWVQISMPEQIDSYFTDKIKKTYNVKYSPDDKSSSGNSQKEDILKNKIPGNIYLKKDKSLIIFTGDTVYYRTEGLWAVKKIPGITGLPQNYPSETGIGNICVIKDSVIMESFGIPEDGGLFVKYDMRKENQKWDIISEGKSITGVIPGNEADDFWFSTGRTGSNIEGRLEYYKSGKTEQVCIFDDSESVIKLNMNQKNPVYSFYKNGSDFYILTNESVFLYREKYLKKLFYYLDPFRNIFADGAGNIYLYTKKEGLTKYVKTGEGYKREAVSFVNPG
jgi:hypothetical protein